MKTALIFGSTGQDGHYLSKILVRDGYQVFGTSRKRNNSGSSVFCVNPLDRNEVRGVVKKVMPDEIYNLLGPSSVGRSFGKPEEYITDVIIATYNITDVLLDIVPAAHFVNASSVECFGDCNGPIHENSEFSPLSPYGMGKVEAANIVNDMMSTRNATNVFLSNHESPLRPAHFVTSKIVDGAIAISRGESKKLALGNLNVVRDWGYARDYMEAVALIGRNFGADLNSSSFCRYVISSGSSFPLKKFVEYVFNCVNLDHLRYVKVNREEIRRDEAMEVKCNPSKAFDILNWKSSTSLIELARLLVNASLERDRATCS